MDDAAKGCDELLREVQQLRERVALLERLGLQSECDLDLRARLVALAAGGNIYDWDLGTGAIVNDGTIDLFGYGLEEVGTNYAWWYDHVHPEERERVAAGLQAALQGPAHFWVDEYRYRRRDGTYAHVTDRAFILRDRDGRACRVLGCMADVTATRAAQVALREREHLVRRIAETVPSVIWVYDVVEDRDLYVNRDCLAGLGYDGIHPTACAMPFLRDLLHPDDRGCWSDCLERARRARDDEILECEYRLRTADGTYRRFHDHYVVFGRETDGTPRQLLGVTQDITTRWHAEEAVRAQALRLQARNAALARLGHSASVARGDWGAAVREVVGEASRTLEVERACVWMFVEDGSRLVCATRLDRPESDQQPAEEFEMSDGTAFRRLLEGGRTLAVADAGLETRAEVCEPPVRACGLRAFVLAPVRVGGEVVGFLCLGHTQAPRIWDQEDETFAASLADTLAIAYEAQERGRVEEFQSAVFRIAGAAQEAQDLEALFAAVHGIVAGVMPAESFFIALRDEPTGRITFPYFADPTATSCPPRQPSGGLTEHVLQTGETLHAGPEELAELERRGIARPLPPPAPPQVWLGVPLALGQQVLGVMAVQSSTDPRAYGARERSILEYVSAQLARAIEHHRQQAALRESEERYRMLFDSSPEVIGVTDLETLRIVEINEAATRVYGYTREELVGKSLHDLRPPAEWPALECQLAALRPGEPMRWTARHRRKDGSMIDVEATVLLMDLQGRRALFGMARDITERTRAERLERALYAIAQQADTVPDLQSLYAAVHRSVQHVMAATSFAIALYDPAEDLITFPYCVDAMDPPWEPRKPGRGLTEYLLRTGKSLLCTSDVRAELLRSAEITPVGTPSAVWLGVPLRVEERTIGVMIVQDYENPDQYGPREQQMLEYVSSQVARVIHRKRAEEQLAQRARQQALVADLGQRALAASDLGPLLDAAVVGVAAALEVDCVDLLELQPDGSTLALRAGTGWREGLVGETTWSLDAGGAARDALLSPEPTCIEDLRCGPAVPAAPHLREHGLVSGARTVVQGKPRPWGVLGAWSRRRRSFTGDDLHFMTAVSNVLAAAVERRRVEAALRESEHRYRLLFDRHPHPMWLADMETRSFVAVNRAAVEQYGYTEEEFLGMRLEDIRPTEDAPAFVAAFEAPRGGIGRAGVWRHRRKDGTLLEAEITTEELDLGGRAMRLVLAVDVTERQRAVRRQSVQLAVARVLAESRTREEAQPELLRAVAESLGWDLAELWERDDAADRLLRVEAWARDAELRAALAGEGAACHPLGCGQGLPGCAWEAGTPVWNSDVAAETGCEHGQAAWRAGLRGNCAFPIRSAGRVLGVVMLFSRAERHADDEMAAVLGVLGGQIGEFLERKHVEAALRASEERYRMVTWATRGSVWDWDVVHDLAYYAGTHTVGGHPAAEANGNPDWWASHVHPEDGARVTATLAAAIERRDSRWTEEYRFRTHDGDWAHVIDQGYLVYDAAGRAVRMIGCMTDETPRKEAEAALVERNRELLTLHRISEIGLRDQPLRETCDQIVHEAAALAGFPIAVIDLYDPEREVVRFVGLEGVPREPGAADPEASVDEAICGIVIRTRSPLIETRIQETEDKRSEMLRRLGVQTFFCLPMVVGGQVLGTLSLAHRKQVEVEPGLLRSMASVANYVAAMLERQRMQRAVQEERDFALQVMTAMGQGLTVTGPDRRFEYVNPAYARMLGTTPADLVGRSPFEVVHPEDHPVLEAQIAPRAAGLTSTYELRSLGAGGGIVHALVTASPRWRGGEVTGSIAVITDLSEKKRAEEALRESEERLSLALWGSNQGLWDYDVRNDKLLVQPSHPSIMGYDADEMEPKLATWEDLLHPEDRERALAAFHDHLAGRTPFYECEYRLRDRSGAYRWLLDRGKVVACDAQGAALRVVGTHRDVHEWKEAQARVLALEVKQRQLERIGRLHVVRAQEAERAKLSRELHDGVGQLLTGLQMRLLARDGGGGDLAQEIASARLAARTVGELSRLLHPPELEESSVFAVVQDRLCTAGSSSQPQVRAEISGTEPALGAEIKSHLFRIVQEAVNNSLKHAQAQHVQVRFAWEPAGLVLAVADDGRGMRTPARAGVGTRSIRDRAAILGGEAAWQGNDQGGTTVQLRVPQRALRPGARLERPRHPQAPGEDPRGAS